MKNWLRKKSLFQRLLFFFMIVILLPLFLTSIIIYSRTAALLQSQVENFLNQSISVTNLQVDRFLQEYELITLPLVTDANVKKFIQLDADQEFARYQSYTNVMEKMKQVESQNPAIDLIYIIDDKGYSVLSDDRYYSPDRPFPIIEVHDKLSSQVPDSGKVTIKSRKNMDGEIVITFARKIRNAAFKPKGVLGVDISFSDIAEFWSLPEETEGSYLMITDQKGKLVYHPDSELFGAQLEAEVRNQLNKQEKGSFFHEGKEGEMFYYYHTSDYTGWKTIVAIPSAELYQPISGIRTTTFVTGSISILIALMLAFTFTRRIVTPIRLLQSRLEKMEKGIWSKVPAMDGTDEIAGLVSSYNRMVDELTDLIDRVYYAELKSQKSQLEIQERELEWQKNEFQALQSQINPHFLYNTLETMNAYAMIKGADEISEMADALAYMFRYSVKNLGTVQLADELNHVNHYLTIQEHRLQKPVILHVECEPELLSRKTVKLSLQPLVENAIEHGLVKSKKDGRIKISVKLEGDLFYIQVEDNGKGMSKERHDEINKYLENYVNEQTIDGAGGIGLKNVHRRIQLIFGEAYGLRIRSNLDKGTNITIVIPASTEEVKHQDEAS